MNPLTALFQALETAGVGLDVEVVRDAVWLASHLATTNQLASAVDEAAPAAVSVPATTPAGADMTSAGSTETARGEPVAPRSYAKADRPAAQATGAAPAFSRVRLPRAAGLVGERGIPGALRPLRRKIRSPTAPIDEIATVRRATEDDLWLPVYRYIADRWLELALVVDNAVSMTVWQEVARELRRVFTRAAAFRDVRVWSLSSEGDFVGVSLHSSRSAGDQAPTRVRSPFGGGRRGLVLAMSDCVSAGWYDGRVLSLLHQWSRESPVALLQVLPERMWSRTALAEATRVKLRAVATAMTNPHLHWAAELPLPEAGWRSQGAGVGPELALFPVVTAEPASLRRLARMVAGISDESLSGVMFETAAKGSVPVWRAASPEERVRRFWSVSSSAAAELASLLSAAPVQSTGVLTLLRRELLPGSDPSVEAEVLFSGLLSVPKNVDARDGDLPLEFQAGVRRMLLENAPVDRVFEVLRKVAAHTPIPGIAPQTFESWIVSPSSAEEQLHPGADPMAAQVVAVLEQIGGAYARIVHPEARRGPAAPQPSAPPPGAAGPEVPTEDSVKGETAPESVVDVLDTPAPSAPSTTRKRICFVVSGFGVKTDYATGRSLDLDQSYRYIIKPAVEKMGLECIRADEVIYTGVIEKRMFELLLDADVVIADLSTSNADTIYQLGVRHALRPHTTIVIAEHRFRFPLDLGHMPIIAYEHLGTGIDFGEVERVRELLRHTIQARLEKPEVDSPVYTFLPALQPPGSAQDSPGLHTATSQHRPVGDSKRTCFVIMGFGEKLDFATGRTLDLDKSYQMIKKAVEEMGFECVRADEVLHSGTIDKPIYELLVAADVVIADLSTSNASALYELGIRHARRPRTTILMAERQFRIPFEIRAVSFLLYEHLGEGIGVEEAHRVGEYLKESIRRRIEDPKTDSPVYAYLPSLLPGTADDTRVEGEDDELKELTTGLRDALAASDWMGAAALARHLIERRPADPYFKRQLALATYKSRSPDPGAALSSAKAILEELNPRSTRDTETLGLWAAVHKRMWDLSQQPRDLDEAIEAYGKAFDLKTDYYNGINLSFLLTLRASRLSPQEARVDTVNAERIRRQVITICEELLKARERPAGQADQQETYWIKATLAEALWGVGETARANELQSTLNAEAPEKWMADVLNEQLSKLQALLAGGRPSK